MAILTAALSVGLIHLLFQHEHEIVETSANAFKLLSFFLTTFIGVTVLPYLVPAYVLSQRYESTVHFTIVGLYGLFFYTVALIFSLAPGMFVYLIFLSVKVNLEVLLFAFTGGMKMFIMRGLLRTQYNFITSRAIKWNIFLTGVMGGTLVYWILVMMSEYSFYDYRIDQFIAYSVFLIIFNTTLIFSLAKVNFKVVNIILVGCFIAFLLDVFINQRFDPILDFVARESGHFGQ